MHNSLDKQPAKQNAPVVAIEGCGQDLTTIYSILYHGIYVKLFVFIQDLCNLKAGSVNCR